MDLVGVQIDSFLIDYGHDSRRNHLLIRSPTQARLRAAHRSHGAIAGCPSTHRGVKQLKKPPPAFVKVNKTKVPEDQKQVRKKRDTKHNRARARSQPTQFVEHRLVRCPSCELRLGGITLARVREVIDIPPPAPVEVTHHRIYKGWCSGCQCWHEAPVDLHEQVVGHGRIGVRLSSLIATLRTVMRLPIRQIRELLHTLHGFEVSIGEIVEILHRIREHAQPVLDDLHRAIRASPAVQADETGWREDGENGYIWSVSTPDHPL